MTIFSIVNQFPLFTHSSQQDLSTQRYDGVMQLNVIALTPFVQYILFLKGILGKGRGLGTEIGNA
jgi:hypothetical protein